ncbi:MAG: XTP/dITP diphosphatase [Hahellaceae bacterium]|nr:XTP/dITP diphosphatase [Hahellaceae bacterium]MCP5209656.1 XTP/dITP diphosphatase [Hahellaceae bacterium]
MFQLVLASNNNGKIRELDSMLKPLSIQVLPQATFSIASVKETGKSFVENAILKARHVCEETGLAAIADDSGLEVDCLQGAPGIYSARYAGEQATDADNYLKLLEAMKGLPPSQRTARFQCVLVLMNHAEDPTPLICQGTWEGVITEEPLGDNGFGYDPVFFVPQLGKTSAQLTQDEKNCSSHRAQALGQLLTHLHQKLGHLEYRGHKR